MNDLAVNRYAVHIARLRVLARLGVLAVLTVIIAVEHPRPDGHGRGLVILVTLALTIATEAASSSSPTARRPSGPP